MNDNTKALLKRIIHCMHEIVETITNVASQEKSVTFKIISYSISDKSLEFGVYTFYFS